MFNNVVFFFQLIFFTAILRKGDTKSLDDELEIESLVNIKLSILFCQV